VGLAGDPVAAGYWLVASDGGIFAFGAAKFFGSTGSIHLNQPIVGMASTPDGQGYWLVASDGGIFSYGDAGFFGSTGSIHLNQPIVGMASTPDGQGYWLVAADGGIFSYGDAKFFGSTGGTHLNKPIVGMSSTPDGQGYWLVASDGGIFSYGDAKFFGSTGSLQLNSPIVAMTSSPDGAGYWMVAGDGGVFTFGDATFRGSLGGKVLPAPAVSMATTHSLDPYQPGATGFDISWPQCGSSFPSPPFGVAVVGVNDGLTFTKNPCLSDEAAWGRQGGLTLYMNLDSPRSSQASQAASGPAGTCSATDAACQAYNYGFNTAQFSYQYAASVGALAPMWWLDIEGPAGSGNPLWSSDTSANAQEIAGAVAALDGLGVEAGVYSTPFQWGQIAGGYAPDIPMWEAGANNQSDAPNFCGPSKAFTSGPIWLVQFAPNPLDGDFAC
jgi:hypothetical protein